MNNAIDSKSLESIQRDVAETFKNLQLIDDVEESQEFKNIEFKLDANRILTILDTCKKKTKLAFCLTALIDDDPDLIERKTNKLDALKIITAFKRLSNQMGPECIYIETNLAIDESINIALKHNLHENVSKYLDTISELGQRYLNALTELKLIIEQRLSWTAPREMAKEKLFHQIWLENEKLKSEINELQTEVETDNKKIINLQRNHQINFENHNEMLKELKETNIDEINRTINESHGIMKKMCKESEIKRHELKIKACDQQEMYDSLLQKSLNEETILKKERLKQQQKLQSLIEKYDKDIGERNTIMFKLIDDLEEKKFRFDLWKVDFDSQEIEFNILMAEKEVVDRKIRDEKLLEFTRNRAARIIQRSYRKLLRRRKRRNRKMRRRGGRRR